MSRTHSAHLLALASATALLASAPADALIVYDPTNYASNVLQAARALEQINNQIRSLQNQATSLLNEGRNLASLPFSSLQALAAQVQQTRTLLTQAERLAYDVRQIDQAFSSRYGAVSASTSNAALVEGARDRWETSVAAFKDALKVQAGVVGNLDGTHSILNALLSRSQSATGALQAAQAGNQLVALQIRQVVDMTAVMAAASRAQAIEAARGATAEAEGRARFARFVKRGPRG